ncbi:hypothetical protein EIN_281280 [Entamoeba invadens IP1]|uniref:Uncharacterized protein n=1 Tax=Entamoeba invadens IP1 TaxID=370355 RepID=A0A0A1TX00_ENTIV|nr:hypothetical protein EIN_281280 [Entamoeba invadens IP1]ELP85767.1 hypothetical protein EIN_281280 [Entamoeba invadens IP1]|eukprot:XP_004185113.1 hypothetical protein EIN_281280 [Entamoeba invadens IP1]
MMSSSDSDSSVPTTHHPEKYTGVLLKNILDDLSDTITLGMNPKSDISPLPGSIEEYSVVIENVKEEVKLLEYDDMMQTTHFGIPQSIGLCECNNTEQIVLLIGLWVVAYIEEKNKTRALVDTSEVLKVMRTLVDESQFVDIDEDKYNQINWLYDFMRTHH